MLEIHFSQDSKKYKEYLLVCERLGKDPDPKKIPMSIENYPYEVQISMEIHRALPDRWDGMSGSYMGKDWSPINTYLNAYDIKDKQTILFFIKVLEMNHMKLVNEDLEKQRKERERKDSQANVKVPKLK